MSKLRMVLIKRKKRTMKKQSSLVATLSLLLVATIPVFAHDYWFKPESYFARVGGNLQVRLYVGDEYKIIEERLLQRERTVSFQMFTAKQPPVDLAAQGKDNQSPVANLSFKSAGNHLIAMERKASTIKLEAKKFTAYLAEEGLDSIIALRKQASESDREGRERYRRYLKALFQVGDQRDDTYQHLLGQRLEIVPQSNPYGMKLGDTLRVRILFEGKPLVGAKVFGYNGSGSDVHEQAGRTAGDGTVAFKLDRSGEWLVRLVHMRRCVADCAEIDWESFWGAYTFGMK